MFGLKTELPKPDVRNYLLLDPTMPKKGKRSARWRLILNIEENELKVLE